MKTLGPTTNSLCVLGNAGASSGTDSLAKRIALPRPARWSHRFPAGALMSIGTSLLSAQNAQYIQRGSTLRQGSSSNVVFLNPNNLNLNRFGNLFSYPKVNLTGAEQ